ncbi:hypothetical protein RAL98_04175 [Staphylococcus sp. HKU1]|uniref:hypothetical protein n=1 Tax=Staphylococcus sp. HKU1 TaxID=3068989 RepID=UPI003AAA658E
MKLVNYSIEHDDYNELVTIYAETNKGYEFNFSFSDTHTLREVKNKLEELAEKIDNDSKS